jgi:hypothetical protein
MNQRYAKTSVIVLAVSALLAVFLNEWTGNFLFSAISWLSMAPLVVLLPLILLQPGLIAMVSTSVGLLLMFALFHGAGRRQNAGSEISSRPPALAYDAAMVTVAMTALAALWLGEHHTAFVIRDEDAKAALLPPIVIIFLLRRAGRMMAIRAAIGIYILFLVIWFTGSKEANLAFNDCVHNGEYVRMELVKHKSLHGRYPETLDQLDTHLPGRLLLPPHLLRYERTSSGYRLGFSDFLVSHAATESEEFMAHK